MLFGVTFVTVARLTQNSNLLITDVLNELPSKCIAVRPEILQVFSFGRRSGRLFYFLPMEQKRTRRDRLRSAPYLRLKNIQRTTIGNIWKNYFFQKKIVNFFSKKKYFLESRTMPKNSKRGHSGSLNVFTNRKLQKMQGVTV